MSTEPTPMQFDNAEYDGGAAAPTGIACAACKRSIVDQYYEAVSKVYCGDCAAVIKAGPKGGSRLWRTIEAMLLGIMGGAIGALIWFLIRKFTGYELGLIAILVGVFVGGGVRKGSRRRGGWFYQLMAIVVTYVSIASTYVPLIIADYDATAVRDHEDIVKNATTVAKLSILRDGSVRIDDAESPAMQWKSRLTQLKADNGTIMRYCEGSNVEAYRAPVALEVDNLIDQLEIPTANFQDAAFKVPLYETFENTAFEPYKRPVIFAIVCIVALIGPFLSPAQNIMGLIIIAIALYEAWKINKKPRLAIAGPFVLSSGGLGQGSIVHVLPQMGHAAAPPGPFDPPSGPSDPPQGPVPS